MSEENELNEGDLIVPAPDNFSLFDMLDGVEYPEEEVTVALNERAAYRLAALNAEVHEYRVKQVEGDPEKEEEFSKRLAEIREALEKSKVTFYLKGVPDDVLSNAGAIAEKKFESKKRDFVDAQGVSQKVLPNDEKINFMRYLNAVTYSLFITKVRYHANGAVRTAPDPDEIAAFMDKAPGAAKGMLVSKIQDLRVESANYESTFDEGFFRKS